MTSDLRSGKTDCRLDGGCMENRIQDIAPCVFSLSDREVGPL